MPLIRVSRWIATNARRQGRRARLAGTVPEGLMWRREARLESPGRTLCYAPKPPSTLVQEPFPVTGPASAGTERGTRALSWATGTQGAVGAILVVLALGLGLRLIVAFLLPGSGFGVDLGAFRAWAI